MAKKPRKLTKKEIEQQRAAMDRVLAAAKAECTEMLRIVDFANWLLYACARDDARATAWDMLKEGDPEERRRAHKHTVKNELLEMEDVAYDDGADAAIQDLRDQAALGKRLDPGFNKPILEQQDWLFEDPRETESAEVLRRVVDNAIDSSRRAAKRRKK
jgi:hypothetical protein